MLVDGEFINDKIRKNEKKNSWNGISGLWGQ